MYILHQPAAQKLQGLFISCQNVTLVSSCAGVVGYCYDQIHHIALQHCLGCLQGCTAFAPLLCMHRVRQLP
jgi:hypothetical protein